MMLGTVCLENTQAKRFDTWLKQLARESGYELSAHTDGEIRWYRVKHGGAIVAEIETFMPNDIRLRVRTARRGFEYQEIDGGRLRKDGFIEIYCTALQRDYQVSPPEDAMGGFLTWAIEADESSKEGLPPLTETPQLAASPQITGKCPDPKELIATIQALAQRNLPPDNPDPLHSGRIEALGEVLGGDERHRRHIISAEWRGVGRYPIGYIELYPAVDNGCQYELARYDPTPEMEGKYAGYDEQTQNFFNGLTSTLRPELAQARLRSIAIQSQEAASGTNGFNFKEDRVTVKHVDEEVYLSLQKLASEVYRVEREQVGEIVTRSVYKNGKLMGKYQIMRRREDGAVCFGSIDHSDNSEIYKEWYKIVEIIWIAIRGRFDKRVKGAGFRGWIEQPAAGVIYSQLAPPNVGGANDNWRSWPTTHVDHVTGASSLTDPATGDGVIALPQSARGAPGKQGENNKLDSLIETIKLNGLGHRPESDLEMAAAWLAWNTTPKAERPRLDTWLADKFGVDGHNVQNLQQPNFHNYKRKVPGDRLRSVKEN